MKRKIGIILSIFICFISISAFASTQSASIEQKTINRKQDHLQISIKLPIIKTNNKSGEFITNKIATNTQKWLEDVEELAKSDYNSNEIKYEAFANYDVEYNNNNFLSILTTNYQYTGGAHGMTFKIPYNFDLKTNKELKLSDLFKDSYDYKKIIDDTVRKEIAKHKDYYFNNGEDFKGIKENQDYYITNDGIVVYFGLYEIAPYSSGIREFLISKDTLKNGFKLEIYQ